MAAALEPPDPDKRPFERNRTAVVDAAAMTTSGVVEDEDDGDGDGDGEDDGDGDAAAAAAAAAAKAWARVQALWRGRLHVFTRLLARLKACLPEVRTCFTQSASYG